MSPAQGIRCQECGQPLSSWAERHTVDDCAWWKATQPTRDTLAAVGKMQAELRDVAS